MCAKWTVILRVALVPQITSRLLVIMTLELMRIRYLLETQML